MMNWLLLRGLVRQVEHWGDFPQVFNNMSDTDRVICIDQPGVGTENGRIFSPRISDVVKDIRKRFLKEVDIREGKWGILGHSLGGMVAMQWVNDYPQDFSKLVCISTSSREIPVWKRLTLFSFEMVAKIFMEEDVAERERMILELTSNLRKNDPQIIREWTEIARKCPPYRHVAVEQLLSASLFKLPKNIATETLILASRGDRMVDYHCSQYIAKTLKAPIKVHPTAGHDIPLDDPAWVIEQVSSWI